MLASGWISTDECWGEGDDESEVVERRSPYWDAQVSFPGEGVVRFAAGERVAELTLDDLFTHCEANRLACSVGSVIQAR